MININALDIVDGNVCIILGLLWTIISHFNLEEYVRLSSLEQSDAGSSRSSFSSTASKSAPSTSSTSSYALSEQSKQFTNPIANQTNYHQKSDEYRADNFLFSPNNRSNQFQAQTNETRESPNLTSNNFFKQGQSSERKSNIQMAPLVCPSVGKRISPIEEIDENHEMFASKSQQAQSWIRSVISELDEMAETVDYDLIVENIKVLEEFSKKNCEYGQVYIQDALNAGRKVLTSSTNCGNNIEREVLLNEMSEIQSKWNNYLLKLSQTRQILTSKLGKINDEQKNLAQLQERQKELKQWLIMQQLEANSLSESSDKRLYSLANDIQTKVNKLTTLISNLKSNSASFSGNKQTQIFTS